MKRSHLLLILLSLLFSVGIYAQQESQYTQYMYNTMLINPGYAGSREVPSVFGMHRSQWIGIPGAPKTSAISFHMPFEGKNVGLGVSVFHESIGPQVLNMAMLDFSYTLEFEKSKLAFGVKGIAGLYNFDRNKLRLVDPNDPEFLNMPNSLFYPNVGAGIFWYSDNYYVGVSVPNILSTKIMDTNRSTVSTFNSTQHYYLTGGYVFDLSDSVKFKPAFLTKVAEGAPLQFDLSANFMFNERFIVGAAWRWSAAVGLMAGFQINKNWFIGYAYDLETTDLARYNSGSHEIFLRYEWFRDIQRVISPRFF